MTQWQASPTIRELAIHVHPPTPGPSIAGLRTGMEATRSKIDDTLQTGHHRGMRPALGRPISELTEVILPPTGDPTIHPEPASVPLTGSEPLSWPQTCDGHRTRLVVRTHYAELAKPTVAPATYRAISLRSAGVPCARRHHANVHQPRHQTGVRAMRPGSSFEAIIPQLREAVATPAVHIP